MQSPAPTVDRGAVMRRAGVHQLVGRDEEGAVAAEADRDDLDAVRDELAGGGVHVAQGGQRVADELGELLVVGLDEVRAGGDGRGIGAPEESTATRMPRSRTRVTSSA